MLAVRVGGPGGRLGSSRKGDGDVLTTTGALVLLLLAFGLVVLLMIWGLVRMRQRSDGESVQDSQDSLIYGFLLLAAFALGVFLTYALVGIGT
jgi:hypothetical protein